MGKGMSFGIITKFDPTNAKMGEETMVGSSLQSVHVKPRQKW
jgi:hypothetical protein